MMKEGEPLAYTDLVRKTHTRKDGTFIDKRAEALVLEVEQAVELLLTHDGSPQTNSQNASTKVTSNSRQVLLNQEYIKRGQKRKGPIDGLGSVQYKNPIPSQHVLVSLKRNLDVKMHMNGVEDATAEVKTVIVEVKADLRAFKADFKHAKVEQRNALNMILKALQPQVSTAATTGPTPTETHGWPEASRPAPVSHPTTTHHYEFDRWCAKELGL